MSRTDRQLSIIDALENGTRSSTVAAKTGACASIVALPRKGPRSSTSPVLALAEIERRRKAAKISIARMLSAASIHPSTYRDGRKQPGRLRPKTLRRLADALDALIAGAVMPGKTLAPITALHRCVFALLATRLGYDVDLMLRQDFSAERPQNETWLRASHLRRYAMAVLAVDLDLGNATVARALDCSRQNVDQARRFVENAREDQRVDAAMAVVAALATGRGD